MRPQDRIAGRVERVGDHDFRHGKLDRTGIPVMKHNSKSTTVRRLIWELAHGPSPPPSGCTNARAAVFVSDLNTSASPTQSRRPSLELAGLAGVVGPCAR